MLCSVKRTTYCFLYFKGSKTKQTKKTSRQIVLILGSSVCQQTVRGGLTEELNRRSETALMCIVISLSRSVETILTWN